MSSTSEVSSETSTELMSNTTRFTSSDEAKEDVSKYVIDDEKTEKKKWKGFNFWFLLHIIDWVMVIGFIVVWFTVRRIARPVDIGFPERFSNSTEYSFSVRSKPAIPDWVIVLVICFRFLTFKGDVIDQLCVVFLCANFVVPLILVIQLIYFVLKKSNLWAIVHDIHHGVLGALIVFALNILLTEAIKNLTGSPRPDFKQRCPEKDVWECKKEYYKFVKSFPSGRTSMSFSVMCYLSMYLMGKLRIWTAKNDGGSVIKFFLTILPICVAGFISMTKIWDHHHRNVDIVCGAVLGAAVAQCYYLLFPPLSSDDCHLPKNRYKRYENEKFRFKTLLKILIES